MPAMRKKDKSVRYWFRCDEEYLEYVKKQADVNGHDLADYFRLCLSKLFQSYLKQELQRRKERIRNEKSNIKKSSKKASN